MKKVLKAFVVVLAIIGGLSVFCYATSPDVADTGTEQTGTEQTGTEQTTEQIAAEQPQVTVTSTSDPADPAVTLTTYESEPTAIEYQMLISAGTDTVQIATIGWDMYSTEQKNAIIGITKTHKPGTTVTVGHTVTKITKVTLIEGIPTTQKGYDKQWLVEYEFEAKNLGVTTTGTNQIMVKYRKGITHSTTIQDNMNEGCCLCFGGYIKCPSKSTGNCAPCGDATAGEAQCSGSYAEKQTNYVKNVTRVNVDLTKQGNDPQSQNPSGE